MLAMIPPTLGYRFNPAGNFICTKHACEIVEKSSEIVPLGAPSLLEITVET
jgi:hypothetical protein